MNGINYTGLPDFTANLPKVPTMGNTPASNTAANNTISMQGRPQGDVVDFSTTQEPPAEKKSGFLGTLVKLACTGLVIGSLIVTKGRSKKIIQGLGKDAGVVAKAKALGKAFYKNLNPTKWSNKRFLLKDEYINAQANLKSAIQKAANEGKVIKDDEAVIAATEAMKKAKSLYKGL